MSIRTLIPRILVGILGVGAYVYFVKDNGEQGLIESEQASSETKSGALSMRDSLIGVWQSEGDVNFVREFRADGTIVDEYGGPEHAEVSGTWSEFSAEKPVGGVNFPLEEGAIYIRATFDGELYNYRVVSVTDTALELIYMDRGGVLSFTKVQ